MQLLPFLFLGLSQAVTTIHYYKNPSCNTGTDVGNFDAPINDTATDTQCHSIQNSTRALYINGLDSGCAVIAYTATECDEKSAVPKLAEKGDCFYLETRGVIASWRSVCGDAKAEAERNIVGTTAAQSSSSTSGNTTASATSAVASATSSVANGAEMLLTRGYGIGGVGIGLGVSILMWIL